jgi:ketosteroid isomerase-like protein
MALEIRGRVARYFSIAPAKVGEEVLMLRSVPALMLILLALGASAEGSPAPGEICHAPVATPAPADTAQRAFDDLTAALNARTIEVVLASMTQDLVLSYPNIDDLKRPGLDQSFRKRLASETSRTIKTDIQEVCESGDLAIFRVTWIVDYTGADGKVTTTRERDVEVWRRDDGRWRLARGMSLPSK